MMPSLSALLSSRAHVAARAIHRGAAQARGYAAPRPLLSRALHKLRGWPEGANLRHDEDKQAAVPHPPLKGRLFPSLPTATRGEATSVSSQGTLCLLYHDTLSPSTPPQRTPPRCLQQARRHTDTAAKQTK